MKKYFLRYKNIFNSRRE